VENAVYFDAADVEDETDLGNIGSCRVKQMLVQILVLGV
jgi:hypothetical protein